MNVNRYFVNLDLDCSELILNCFIFSEIVCIKLSWSCNGQKCQNMLHCLALPYILIKKFLCAPYELNFNCVVTLFSFFFSLLVLHHCNQWRYSKEQFVDQEKAKHYICEICSNVLKDAIQIHDVRDEKRVCRECYIQKLK